MQDRLKFEQTLWDEGYSRVMGLDEAGRGCLSGPVVAGGVIFEPGEKIGISGIRDSKQLSRVERERLAEEIINKALYWTVRYCDVSEIEQYNILWASVRAMQKCVDSPEVPPDYLLVDGNRFTDSLVPYSCLVKGDDRSVTVAAASILAKVHRDNYMRDLHKKYPHYGWDTNVGYPTRKHFEGLKVFGITRHHRRNFRLGTEKIYSGEEKYVN